MQAATGEEIEKEAFYQKVEEVYDSYPSNDLKIFLEDLKAKVWSGEICQGLIGRQSIHLNTNNYGQNLVNFAATENIVVSSTCFSHKEIHKKHGDLIWRNQ